MASRRCGDLPQDLFSLLCPNLLRGLPALSVNLLVMLVSRVDGEAHPRVDERPSHFNPIRLISMGDYLRCTRQNLET